MLGVPDRSFTLFRAALLDGLQAEIDHALAQADNTHLSGRGALELGNDALRRLNLVERSTTAEENLDRGVTPTFPDQLGIAAHAQRLVYSGNNLIADVVPTGLIGL